MENLVKNYHGKIRQPEIKAALNAARAKAVVFKR